MASEGKSRRADPLTPKSTPKKPAPRAGHSRGLLNMDSEQQARALLIGGVVLIIIVALGFIGFGYWYSVVRPRNRTVLQADQIKISYSAIKRRMAYELFQSVTLQQNARALPEITYQKLLEEATVINRAAADLNITPSDDEIDKNLRGKIGVGAEADQKQFADALVRQLDTSGLQEDEYRRLAKAELLTKKIKEKFKLEAPLTIQQARFEVMALNTEDDAKKAIARVQAGEDWATVAKAVSQEVDVQTTGGVHDYTPQTGLNAAYRDYVFLSSTKIGDISAPLPSAAGNQFFVVRVDDRADKPVTEDQKPKIADKQYSDWLVAQQDQMTVVRHWEAQDQADALVSVVNGTNAKIKKQAPRPATTVTQQTPVSQPTAAAPSGGADTNPPLPNAPVAPGSGNGQ